MSADLRLCLALDVPDGGAAAQWVRRTRDHFGIYKIGLQLFCAEGPSIVRAVRDAGAEAIFLDLKLHDIPNTVAKAVESVRGLGVDLLTIHTSGGKAMMQAAAEAAGDMTVLGVTVLTSLGADDLSEIGIAEVPGDAVLRRGQLARDAGLSGLVCSPHEAGALRRVLGPEMKLVTPGIRLQGGASQDQIRISTPGDALQAGADILVIGRAITGASDLNHAIEQLQEAARQP